jgi:V8-like Glu-specific endopeptidase/pimeloyl-ACP methyl ester carboxylesterase
MAHVTFVHGMANKPPADLMLQLWLRALARDDPKPEVHAPPNAGLDLGTLGASVDSVYWADVLYATPETDVSSYESGAEERASIEGVPVADAAAGTREAATADRWRANLSPGEAAFVRRLEEQLRFEAAGSQDVAVRMAVASTVERIPLPDFVKRPLMEKLLRDVHHYFFNVEFSPRPGATYRVRDELQRRFLEHVIAHADERPHVVVCHSMGTFVTYDCVRNRPECPPIDGLITLGSPLGLDEVQDAVAPRGGRVDFPDEKLKGPWINIFDPLDPVVGFDPHFANDYLRNGAEAVVDVRESSWGEWRHNIVKYLAGPRMRAELRRLLAGAELESLTRARTSGSAAAARAAGERESVAPESDASTARASGPPAPPPPAAVARLDANAIRTLDREELARLGDEVARAGTLEGVAAKPEQVVALAAALRAQRLFPELSAVAASAAAKRTESPMLRRLHAQALIEAGELADAEALLRGLLQTNEELEAKGLLGRIEKQRYVNQMLAGAKGKPGQLRKAIDAYLDAYEGDAGKPFWHGINAAALLELGARKKVRHDRSADAQRIAHAIAKRLQQEFVDDKAGFWELATAGEACLALGAVDAAELWYRRAIDVPDVEPFALASSVRQLKEVWGLNAGEGVGRRLLPPLETALARRGKVALFTAQAVGHPDADGKLEKIFGDTGFMSPEKIRLGLKRCEAVGRVEETTGDGVGTGFAVPGSELSDALPGRYVFVTNNHVVSSTNADSLRIGNAQVTFHALRDAAGKPFTTRFASILRESPVDQLDFTVLEFENQPPGLEPYPVADALPTVNSGQRLYVIGHPRGGGLMFSMQDNRLIDHGAPTDFRVHYRTPTEPGSSGSPVFNGGWELVALHHSGSATMNRIHGAGTYEANEGIWIQSIRRSMKA